MDKIFHALSDETRRAMLRDLSLGERTVGELAKPYPMTLAAASKHIKVLEKAGLLRREIRWRTHVCHLEAAPLKQAMTELAYYQQFWTRGLDRLEQLLHQEDEATRSTSKPGKSTEPKGEST